MSIEAARYATTSGRSAFVPALSHGLHEALRHQLVDRLRSRLLGHTVLRSKVHQVRKSLPGR